MSLAGVPQVDGLALGADGFLPAPVGGDDFAVQDHMGQAVVVGPFQRLTQIGGQVRQDGDELLQVAVGGGPRDAMVTGERVGAGAVAEPPQPQYRLAKATQRPAALGCPTPPPLGE